MSDKQLAPGEARYVPKQLKTGRNLAWFVYDRSRGSYPGLVPGFGAVKTAFATEQEAQDEADRLAAFMKEGSS